MQQLISDIRPNPNQLATSQLLNASQCQWNQICVAPQPIHVTVTRSPLPWIPVFQIAALLTPMIGHDEAEIGWWPIRGALVARSTRVCVNYDTHNPHTTNHTTEEPATCSPPPELEA